jgi:hypothetical protein
VLSADDAVMDTAPLPDRVSKPFGVTVAFLLLVVNVTGSPEEDVAVSRICIPGLKVTVEGETT